MDSVQQRGEGAICQISRTVSLLLNELNNNVVDVKRLRALVQERGIPGEEVCIRRVVWCLLLGFLPEKREEWKRTILEKGLEYSRFCDDLILDLHELGNEAVDGSRPLNDQGLERQLVSSNDHPLSTHSDSVWNTYFQDKEMREQIDRDVERTHPDLNFFSGVYSKDEMPHRSKMGRSLFVYYKLNPGIRYVQGMNELYAVLYYVIGAASSRNTVDEGLIDMVDVDPEVAAFYCFVDLMGEFRDNFCVQLDKSQLGISGRMQQLSQQLKCFDPLLWQHLESSLQIVPQLYAFRWVTTLFTQDFELPEVIIIWDHMLAVEDSRSDYILRVCTAMLMLERENLLKADFAQAMKILQHYPAPDLFHLLKDANSLVDYKSIIILDD